MKGSHRVALIHRGSDVVNRWSYQLNFCELRRVELQDNNLSMGDADGSYQSGGKFWATRGWFAGQYAEGVKNEESQDHPDIFVCGGPRLAWPDFWVRYRNYG